MKKTITTLKTFALLFLLTIAFKGKSQCAANFIYNIWPNGNVTFTSTSVTSTVSSTTYYWSFGNNTTFSATGAQGAAAVTNYTANGTYVVTLFILSTSPTCSAAIQQTLTINSTTTGACPLSPSWWYTQSTNGAVNFVNNSLGTNSGSTYSWNFGDNTAAGTTASPAHTYSANGQYTVSMTVTNNSTCTATFTNVINVTSYCMVQANYSYTNGANGLVNFMSTSTGTNASSFYKWIFGDGNQTFGGPSMSHTYVNGTYMAILVVSGSTTNPSCVDSVWYSITVTSATCNLVANATINQSSGGVVQFVNNSSGTTANTTYTWSFGNGQTSNQSSPTVTYPSGGVYWVTMHASNASNCNSVKSFSINVSTIPCVANANFTMLPTTTAQHWVAIPSFPWNIANASWSWGDNTPQTNTLGASHQYSAAGMYTICLTVTATCGATATACSSYSVYKGGSSQPIIFVNVKMPDEVNIDGQVPTGIQTTNNESRLSVYPNPTNGDVNLTVSGVDGETATVEIYSLLGNLVYRSTATPVNGSVNQSIDMKDSTNGIYVLKISTDSKAITRKIVLEK